MTPLPLPTASCLLSGPTAAFCAVFGLLACSGRAAVSQPDSRPHAPAGNDAATPPEDAAPSLPYRIDTKPPRDWHSASLLRTLKTEASVVAVCQLDGVSDIFKDPTDLYLFLDVTCSKADFWRGKQASSTVHFIWQVERGSPLPPPGESLLVFLKPRKQPRDPPQSVEWVAVETGVFRVTAKLIAAASQLFKLRGKSHGQLH